LSGSTLLEVEALVAVAAVAVAARPPVEAAAAAAVKRAAAAAAAVKRSSRMKAGTPRLSNKVVSKKLPVSRRISLSAAQPRKRLRPDAQSKLQVRQQRKFASVARPTITALVVRSTAKHRLRSPFCEWN
jgi:hypothetical protein